MTPAVGLNDLFWTHLYYLKVVCLHSPTKARIVPSKNPTCQFPTIPKDTASQAQPDPADWKLEGPELLCTNSCK